MSSDITIISCNYQTKIFADLMVASVKKFSSEKHEILILDNSREQELFTNDDYEVLLNKDSHQHGAGIDFLIKHVKTEFVLVLDIDTHVLGVGFEAALKGLLGPGVGMIAPERTPAKPIHPGMMFFRKGTIVKYDVFFHPVKFTHPELKGYAYDVGQFAPLVLSYQKLKTVTLKRMATCYENTRGDCWYMMGHPAFYHFGYSRLNTSEIIRLRDSMLSQIPWK